MDTLHAMVSFIQENLDLLKQQEQEPKTEEDLIIFTVVGVFNALGQLAEAGDLKDIDKTMADIMEKLRHEIPSN